MAKKKAPVATTKPVVVINDGQPSEQSNVVEVIEKQSTLFSDKLAASVSKPTPSSSMVFELSAEIRVKIWRLVVISDDHIPLHGSTVPRLGKYRLRSGGSSILPRPRINPPKATTRTKIHDAYNSPFAVAMTCRQLYLEATPIYYSGNTFHLPLGHGKRNSRTFSSFRETIGKENAYQISKISINNTLNDPAYVFDQLPGLKSLDIYGWDTSAIFRRKLKKLCQGNEDLVIRYGGEGVDFAKGTPRRLFGYRE